MLATRAVDTSNAIASSVSAMLWFIGVPPGS
jgi:hypothetical protein